MGGPPKPCFRSDEEESGSRGASAESSQADPKEGFGLITLFLLLLILILLVLPLLTIPSLCFWDMWYMFLSKKWVPCCVFLQYGLSYFGFHTWAFSGNPNVETFSVIDFLPKAVEKGPCVHTRVSRGL